MPASSQVDMNIPKGHRCRRMQAITSRSGATVMDLRQDLEHSITPVKSADLDRINGICRARGAKAKAALKTGASTTKTRSN